MASLKNRVALITGASSGIGYSCGIKFAEVGAQLMTLADVLVLPTHQVSTTLTHREPKS
jgi:NAD(P)-dependent dehydrogenase (short-subunit alcohol dehydrogenase family)